jgi:hypothetical protein
VPDPLNLLATKDVTSMINPSKLKTLVDSQASPPSAASMGMAPGGDEGLDDELADDMGDEGDDDGGDPVAKGEAMLTEWGEFGATLKESADMIHDTAMEVGSELLMKVVSDDAKDEVIKAVDRMPDDIQQGLAKYVGKLDDAGLDALTAALAAGLGEEADGAMVKSFLKVAGEYAAAEIEVEEEEEPEEEEEEEEEPEEAPADEETPPDDEAPPVA